MHKKRNHAWASAIIIIIAHRIDIFNWIQSAARKRQSVHLNGLLFSFLSNVEKLSTTTESCTVHEANANGTRAKARSVYANKNNINEFNLFLSCLVLSFASCCLLLHMIFAFFHPYYECLFLSLNSDDAYSRVSAYHFLLIPHICKI